MTGILLTAASNLTMEKMLSLGTSVLTWVLTTFGSIFGFFLDNEGLFIWFGLSLVGAGLIYFKKLI